MQSQTSPDLDALRDDLTRFTRELVYERYMHASGQKETLEITPIYERYGHLFSKDLAKNTLERRENAESEEEKRTYKHLHQFAFFGYLGNATKKITEVIAGKQGEMSITVRGEEIGYHSIAPRLANEPDGAIRREIDDQAAGLEVELNDLRMDTWRITNELFREFGYASYLEGCSSVFGIDYGQLAGELSRFLDETEQAYVEAFDELAQERLDCRIGEARKCDTAYLMRGEQWDGRFPKDAMVEKATRFVGDMGMAPEQVPAIVLDVEERPKKFPRAFCSAVEPGRKVFVCTRPIGGLGDYLTFLHELGHAYHLAHTDPALPAELILVGDSATSEIFAFNFNYLGANPLWLREYVGIDDPGPIAEFLRGQKLYMLRRYSSKLLYELELFRDYRIEGRAELYTSRLDRGLKAKHRVESWLGDLDPAFYCAGYLRAWIFEVQLREHLAKRYGEDWWRNPSAGEELISLWRTGRMYMPEELSERICGRPLDIGPIRRELADTA